MILKGFREFINESTNGATYTDLKLLLELGITDDIQDDMYRGFNQGSITHDELLDWITPICNKYRIWGWTLNREGLVDVDGFVNLDWKDLTRLPIRFGNVTKSFYCYSNQLTTLEGSPREVGGEFLCQDNELTTLKGAPNKVGGDFYCSRNQLTTLEGAPQEVGDSFYCEYNYLTTLEGAPQEVGGNFYCEDNQLTTLEGAPINVGRDFYCENNYLTTLEGAPQMVGGEFWCRNNPLTSLDGIGKVGDMIYSDLDTNESRLFENISIDLEDSDNLKFATPMSKKKLTIEKNTKYFKNGKALNSVITIKTGAISHNYQVYVTGSPFNIESIQPDKNNNVKITYFTGKKLGQTWETKSVSRSLSALSEYLPELISGKNVNPMFIPFKLIRV